MLRSLPARSGSWEFTKYDIDKIWCGKQPAGCQVVPPTGKKLIGGGGGIGATSGSGETMASSPSSVVPQSLLTREHQGLNNELPNFEVAS